MPNGKTFLKNVMSSENIIMRELYPVDANNNTIIANLNFH